jgi:hypothetical protein
MHFCRSLRCLNNTRSFQIPVLDFRGAPTGIDTTLVARTGTRRPSGSAAGHPPGVMCQAAQPTHAWVD